MKNFSYVSSIPPKFNEATPCQEELRQKESGQMLKACVPEAAHTEWASHIVFDLNNDGC